MTTYMHLEKQIDNKDVLERVNNKSDLSNSNGESIDVDENEIANNVVKQYINSLCKKLCFGNRYQYKCTLDNQWDHSEKGALFCEWGNGSYEWMLSELNHLKNQHVSKNNKILHLERYFRKVVTSISFWERYKNWRFQRRIRVPDYIKALDSDASKIFWGLYEQDSHENMAQKHDRSLNEINTLVAQIYTELHKRKRSYILEKNMSVSLSDEDDKLDEDIISSENKNTSYENIVLHESVMDAYKTLNWQEQYILDVMVIDELPATAVLQTLKDQSISIDNKTDPQDLNIQQIYYFLRKTVDKLKQKSKIRSIQDI